MQYSKLALPFALALLPWAAPAASAAPTFPWVDWTTVVNSHDAIPGDAHGRTFNSYNQPSVNVHGLVVIRARSRGGSQGPPVHGIYTRDMSVPQGPIVRILDKDSVVPEPNNLGTTFVETPSFPRVSMASDTIVMRGNHPPVWRYDAQDGTETRAGTTGIYATPLGELVTGAAKLGSVPAFGRFAVPIPEAGVPFEVFPGAPAVTDDDVIVFKGNFALDDVGYTGVFYRQLEAAPRGGASPVVPIADTTRTLIPGTGTLFGSTAPPTAVGGEVVFTGFDDEQAPTLGGIYLAPLDQLPGLTPLVIVGERIPGGAVHDAFATLGEGVAFDGRYVAFWGSWGAETRTVRQYCPTEGNKDRIAYCNQRLECSLGGLTVTVGDEDSVCDDVTDPRYGESCYQDKQVPVHQGIFVHDAVTGRTHPVATTGARFDDFVFWGYSGKPPCTGSGHGHDGSEDDAEPARWRSSAFVAVSGGTSAFVARSGDVKGIYVGERPGRAVWTVLDTTMEGQTLDPQAPEGSTILELGLEREGLRGDWLAISARMGVDGESEDDGLAGVYVTRLPVRPPGRAPRPW